MTLLQNLYLGVDLGGSKILTAVADDTGRILNKYQQASLSEQGKDNLLERITGSIDIVLANIGVKRDKVKAIAVAAPGPIDYEKGMLLNPPNLAFRNLALKNELEKRLKMKISLDNDANFAALGEYYFARRTKVKHLLYLTISTGIGGGMILDGQIYRGYAGGAGEFGHMVIDQSGPVCSCNRRGCLEALASGTAIAKHVKKLWQEGRALSLQTYAIDNQVSAREVAIAAREGNSEAQQIVEQFINSLSIGLGNLINIFNPELLVLGGGVALGMEDLIKEKLRGNMVKNSFPLMQENLKLEFTELGEDIVIMGCLAELIKAEKRK